MAIPSTTLNQVEILFVGYFGRAGDAAGVSFWTNALNNGTATFQSIAALFGSSPEAKAKFPYLASPLVTDPTTFVNQVYQNLFTHGPDAAGGAFWVSYLNANNGNPTAVGTFIATIIQSATVGGADNTTLQNKASVAATFSTSLSNANVPFDAAAAAASSTELATVTADPATVTAANAATAAFVTNALLPHPDLTIGIDAGGAFSVTTTGVTFVADPKGNAPLGVTNSLQAGDNLQDSKGDGILKLTQVAQNLANPPLATDVTMNGLATANITNISGGLGGFSGNITGLTTANILGGTNGNVLLGVASLGLNTALANLSIATGVDQNVTAWFDPAALAGATDAVSINLHGSNQSIDLLVTGPSNNGYETATISSADGANILDLDVDYTSLATIIAVGSQALTMDANSTALNIANLHTFNGTAATGPLTIEFGDTGPTAGVVSKLTVNGGSANDSFTFAPTNSIITANGNAGDDTFVFSATNGGSTTFFSSATDLDTVDGGTGTNRLILQADNGQLLNTFAAPVGGAGAHILNIQTIQHDSIGTTNGTISADMGQSGSATVLQLNGQYGGNDVTITNLITAKSVLFTGDNIDDLSMDATTLLGQVNLTMAQTATGGTQNIDHMHVVVGNLVNLTSAGNATTNLIEDVSDVNANVAITGAHNLLFGFNPALSKATNASHAYDFNTGIIDATAQGTANADPAIKSLQIGLEDGAQTLALGIGNDLVHEWSSDAVDHINLGPLATGGADTVVFHDVFTNGSLTVTAGGTNYTQLLGFNVANDVITLDTGTGAFEINVVETNNTGMFNPPSVFDYSNTTSANLSAAFVDFIKVDAAVGGTITAQALFNQAMGAAGAITVSAGVNGGGHEILMAMYNNDTSQMVLFTVDVGGNNKIDTGDNIDVVGQVTMSLADYHTFGNNGSLTFV